MSANDAARVTQQQDFENKTAVDIKTETTERTPFLVSDILTTSAAAAAEEEDHRMAAAAAANGFESAESASGVAESEEAMTANGGAEGNAGYAAAAAAAAAGSPNGGEDGGGELGATRSLTHSFVHGVARERERPRERQVQGYERARARPFIKQSTSN